MLINKKELCNQVHLRIGVGGKNNEMDIIFTMLNRFAVFSILGI